MNVGAYRNYKLSRVAMMISRVAMMIGAITPQVVYRWYIRILIEACILLGVLVRKGLNIVLIKA